METALAYFRIVWSPIISEHYFSEELTAVPFRILVRGLKQSLPSSMAYSMAAFLRARGSIGWYLRPSYAMGQASDARVVTAEEISANAWGKWAPYLEQLRDLQFNVIAHRSTGHYRSS